MSIEKTGTSGLFETLSEPAPQQAAPDSAPCITQPENLPGAFRLVIAFFQDILHSEYGLSTPRIEARYQADTIGSEDYPAFCIRMHPGPFAMENGDPVPRDAVMPKDLEFFEQEQSLFSAFCDDLTLACETVEQAAASDDPACETLDGQMVLTADYGLFASRLGDYIKILRQLSLGREDGVITEYDNPLFWDEPGSAFDPLRGLPEPANPRVHLRAERLLEVKSSLLFNMKATGVYPSRAAMLSDVLVAERVAKMDRLEELIGVSRRLSLRELELAVRSFEQDKGLILEQEGPRFHLH